MEEEKPLPSFYHLYSYNYDMIGRLVGMNSSLGQSLRISYDSKNRMNYVVSKVGDTSTKTQYVYGDVAQQQKAGLIYGVKIDDKDTVTYTYDNLARISARTLNLTTPFTTSYSYLAGDKAGSTTTMVGSVNNNGNSLIYTYDNLGNIATISEKTSTGSVTQKAKYTYDELSQLVREDNKYINKTITYQYDVGGNLLSKKEYAYTTGTLGTVKKTISYAYGDTNWKDKLTSYNGQAITYDEIGNPLTYRDGMSFTWQNGRQMATLTNGSTSMSFKYDDSGIRTQKTVNGTTTQFYLNGSDILTQITGNERFDFFYDDAGDLLGFKYGGNNYYYIRNLQNDIIGILDSAGTQVVSYVYDSWGKLTSISGSAKDTIGVKNPFRYRGYYYDTESGLYYLNSRYYDAEIGRFVNSDATTGIVGEHQTHNVYAYCFNNPVNFADSTGYIALVDDVLILCTLGLIAIFSVATLTMGNSSLNDKINTSISIPNFSLFSIVSKLQITIIAQIKTNSNLILDDANKNSSNSSQSSGKKATGAGKNGQHGDCGRAKSKAASQIEKLKQQLKKATSRAEKRRIQQKIKNIMEDARRKAKGENHSQKPKR